MFRDANRSSVRFLVASSGTVTTELLGFHASWVGDEKTLIVLNEQLFKFSLWCLIMILLVEGDQRLRDSLTDCHNLRSCTTTLYTDTDVQVLEAVSSEKQDWFPDLKTEGCGLKKLEGLSVNFDEASASGGVSNSCCIFLSAEALNLLCFLRFTHLSLFW